MRIAVLCWLALCLGCAADDSPNEGSEGRREPFLRIGEEVLCPNCEIRLIEVGLLGKPADPASVGPDAASQDCSVGRLSTGEFVLSAVVGGGQIHVYDPDGRVSRTIGRRGEGPGELSNGIRLVVGPQDTLFVMDEGQTRLSVFSAEGEFVRSFRAPHRVQSFALLDHGSFLFGVSPLGPGEALFLITDPFGEESGRFGKGSFSPPELDRGIVAPAFPSGFWTASAWRYELQRWNAAESLDRTVMREADWFPPDGEYLDGMPFTIPAPPVLRHIWDDGQGRVWVYSVVADPAWEPNIPMVPHYEWTRRMFDTALEVIDLEEERVVATGRYDQMLGMVCGSSLVFTVIEAEDGDTRLQLLEPTIVGPR